MRTLSAVLVALCLASVAAYGATPESGSAGAANGENQPRPISSDNKKEYPYELLKDPNGAPMRDEKGNFLVFHKDQGCIIALSVGDFAKFSASQATQRLQRPKDDTVKGLEKKNTPPLIDTKSDPHMTLINMESPAVITELHRRNAEPDISEYKNHLSYNHSVYVRNGEIEGQINVKNLDVRKIADMEVTLVVPTANGNTERYRYRLTTENDIPFVTRPPLPKGRMVMFPVKEKAPIGAGTAQNEKIRTEITYLRFADE